MWDRPLQSSQKPAPHNPQVEVYGTLWCSDTDHLMHDLDRLGVVYQFYDMDRDISAYNRVRGWAGGNASHPIVLIGEQVLVEPEFSEVQALLAEKGII